MGGGVCGCTWCLWVYIMQDIVDSCAYCACKQLVTFWLPAQWFLAPKLSLAVLGARTLNSLLLQCGT